METTFIFLFGIVGRNILYSIDFLTLFIFLYITQVLFSFFLPNIVFYSELIFILSTVPVIFPRRSFESFYYPKICNDKNDVTNVLFMSDMPVIK